MDNQTKVIELLTTSGWLPNGYTSERSYKMITTESYPLAGALVHSGGHPRFMKGDWKVSVGKRIVYFYKPDKDTPYHKWIGVNYATKDLRAIEEKILEVK